jgi:hypothetical protein
MITKNKNMDQTTLQQRLIRFEQLMPCKAAFIDAKTPGSHLKDNFSIIGGGVSESKHQRVNLTELHGFCIGAAGQPPLIKNSPHSHLQQKYSWCIVAPGGSTGTVTARRKPSSIR